MFGSDPFKNPGPRQSQGELALCWENQPVWAPKEYKFRSYLKHCWALKQVSVQNLFQPDVPCFSHCQHLWASYFYLGWTWRSMQVLLVPVQIQQSSLLHSNANFNIWHPKTTQGTNSCSIWLVLHLPSNRDLLWVSAFSGRIKRQVMRFLPLVAHLPWRFLFLKQEQGNHLGTALHLLPGTIRPKKYPASIDLNAKC